MCRFFGLKIFQHPVLFPYQYYWRLDTNSWLLNKIDEDVFEPLIKEKKIYGFKMILYEWDPSVVQRLWDHTREFCQRINFDYKQSDLLDKVIDFNSNQYDTLHFWNNFEVVDLRWFRSTLISSYLDSIDKSAGIYLYRWGDAPLHSMAIFTFANSSLTHYYENIGYTHMGHWHCEKNCESSPTKLHALTNPCDHVRANMGLCRLYYRLLNLKVPIHANSTR